MLTEVTLRQSLHTASGFVQHGRTAAVVEVVEHERLQCLRTGSGFDVGIRCLGHELLLDLAQFLLVLANALEEFKVVLLVSQQCVHVEPTGSSHCTERDRYALLSERLQHIEICLIAFWFELLGPVNRRDQQTRTVLQDLVVAHGVKLVEHVAFDRQLASSVHRVAVQRRDEREDLVVEQLGGDGVTVRTQRFGEHGQAGVLVGVGRFT
ncbi:hypothetical protein D3C85_967630 [compost metagenome]